MKRLVLCAALAAVFPAAALGLHAVEVQNPPARDPNAQPQMRPIPIGTSSISGTVTGDGGKPVKDARVSISGAATVPESALGSLTSEPPGLGRGSGPASASLSVNRSVLTDAMGRFSFPKLPAGHFKLSVSKDFFLGTNYGQKRPGASGTTILVAEGQAFAANMALVKGGVIAGTVFGADGEPAPRVTVTAWRYQLNGNARRWQQTGGSSADENGAYRITNLQPGDYLISATPNSFGGQSMARYNQDAAAVERAIASAPVRPPSAPGLPSTVLVQVPQQQFGPMNMPGYLPTFYPGTPSRSSARLIHVAGGDEHPGTDFIATEVEAGIIVATLSTPVRNGLEVRAALISDDPSAENSYNTSLDQNGKFTFRQVSPGSYTVMFQTVLRSVDLRAGGNGTSVSSGPQEIAEEDRLWGSAVATVVSGATVPVTISLRPGRSISGVVRFEMQRPPDLTRARITVAVNQSPMVSGLMGLPPSAVVEPDGRFTLKGLAPGRYVLRANGGGMTKSAMVGGVDTLDVPLEFTATDDVTDAVLTLTDKFNELSGTLTQADGKPGSDYDIIIATTDEKFWTVGSRRIAWVRTAFDGKYVIRSLPPGDYYVTVVTDFEQGSQYDAEFLKSLIGAATRVRISEGGKTTQDLRVR